MKTYSIGRDMNCDIVIDDNTDVISRRHALLNVSSSGKMTIIDQSNNGTYVNGIRVSSNVPVPVTRKDTISFAHVTKLDWKLVPKSNQCVKYSIIGVVSIFCVVAIIFGIKYLYNGKSNNSGLDNQFVSMQDSIKVDSIAKLDSIKRVAKQDSINKVTAKKDSLRKVRKISKPQKPASSQTNNKDKEKDEHKQERKKPTRVAG